MDQSTPETLAIQQEFSTSFWRIIWGMPSSLRRVITQIYLCNRSYQELAHLLQLPVEDIHNLHGQAIMYLKEGIQTKCQLQ